jgi:hypothetical protein
MAQLEQAKGPSEQASGWNGLSLLDIDGYLLRTKEQPVCRAAEFVAKERKSRRVKKLSKPYNSARTSMVLKLPNCASIWMGLRYPASIQSSFRHCATGLWKNPSSELKAQPALSFAAPRCSFLTTTVRTTNTPKGLLKL